MSHSTALVTGTTSGLGYAAASLLAAATDTKVVARLKPLFHGNVHAAQAYIYNEVQRQSAMLAYLDIIAVIAVMCGLVAPLVFLLGKMEPPKDGPAMH